VAGLLASGSMAYAYFTVHAEHALLPIQNGGELAALFCWSFFLLAITGGGPWSLDALVFGRSGASSVGPSSGPLQPADSSG
jgi:putative oxidoreductase